MPFSASRGTARSLGCCTDVATYLPSGNAVFGTDLAAAALTKAIEGALERYMDRPIATMLRMHGQMKAIVDANPFAKVATSFAHLYVTFLSSSPTQSELAPLHGQDWKPELFQVAGKEIYSWHPKRWPTPSATGWSTTPTCLPCVGPPSGKRKGC